MIKPTEPLDSQQRSQEMKNIVIVLRKKVCNNLNCSFWAAFSDTQHVMPAPFDTSFFYDLCKLT